MARDNKPTGLFYLDHHAVDSVHALIVDTRVTPGGVHDRQPYLARLWAAFLTGLIYRWARSVWMRAI